MNNCSVWGGVSLSYNFIEKSGLDFFMRFVNSGKEKAILYGVDWERERARAREMEEL